VNNNIKMAEVDFECFENDCNGVVKFNLREALEPDFQKICPICHTSYAFEEDLKEKLKKLSDLICAVKKADDILGNCNVSVTVPGKTVKIPYALLLTRLNTMITLKVGDKDVDFHFRVEPGSPDTFGL